MVFNIYQGHTLDLLEELKKGKYDIALCSRISDPELEFMPILAQRLILVVREDHPLAARETVELQELKGHSLTTYRESIPIGKIVRAVLREKGVNLEEHPALQLREYIYDMAPVMRAADLVISRAGASTISELTALGVPALMVPSPYVTNNHQEKNARALEEAGGAAVALEPDSSGQTLFQAASGILRDAARREAMETAMSALGVRNAAERIYQTVLEILG